MNRMVADQEFGVSYQKTLSVTEEMKALLEENERLQNEAQSRLNEQRNAATKTAADDDDEFEFDDTAVNAQDNQEAIKLAIAGIKIEENTEINFKDVVPVVNASAITSSQNDSFQFGALPSIDEPLIMNQKDQPTQVDAKQALNDIVDVYANGMGDQEVLMLDVKDKQAEKEFNSKIVIDKSLGAIAEDEEEEDDEEDDHVSTRNKAHSQKEELVRDADQVESTVDHVQSEWDELEKNSQNMSQSVGIDSRSADVHMIYTKATQFIKSLDLAVHEESIVTTENTSKSWMNVFGGGSSKLDIPNYDTELKFPFLVAQVDYDPNSIDHLSMLKSIYSFLINRDQAIALQPMDKNWEKLGFQGRDPRTDLNRSMKLLSVLQVKTNSCLFSYPSIPKFNLLFPYKNRFWLSFKIIPLQ